jgi:hypothetical protein
MLTTPPTPAPRRPCAPRSPARASAPASWPSATASPPRRSANGASAGRRTAGTAPGARAGCPRRQPLGRPLADSDAGGWSPHFACVRPGLPRSANEHRPTSAGNTIRSRVPHRGAHSALLSRDVVAVRSALLGGMGRAGAAVRDQAAGLDLPSDRPQEGVHVARDRRRDRGRLAAAVSRRYRPHNPAAPSRRSRARPWAGRAAAPAGAAHPCPEVVGPRPSISARRARLLPALVMPAAADPLARRVPEGTRPSTPSAASGCRSGECRRPRRRR